MFHDRIDAGRQLAEVLSRFAGRADVVVLAIPRGGVPVGAEIASALRVPLDIFIVRKLGVPGQEELALGAISSGGIRVLNDEIIENHGIGPEVIAELSERELREIERREQLFGRPPGQLDLREKTVLLIDDGLATGATMRAGIRALRRLSPARLIVAVPVGSPSTCERIRLEADELIVLEEPEDFMAVGSWYENFEQTTDDEVRQLLAGRKTASPVA